MVSIVSGLHQSVWTVQWMQQRGAEGSGEEGGVSSTWPTIKDSEERGKEQVEMLQGHPESNVHLQALKS